MRRIFLGGRIIDAERELDRLFASRAIDEETLRRTLRTIAELQGELRITHLKAHLETDRLRSGGDAPASSQPARWSGGGLPRPPATTQW